MDTLVTNIIETVHHSLLEKRACGHGRDVVS